MPSIVEAARTYIGVPWKHMGRSRRGLDCAGLLIVAAKDAKGADLESPARYGREPFRAGLESFCAKAGDLAWSGPKGACTYDLLRVGDGVLMAPGTQPRHLAIVGDDPMYRFSLIHADGTPGISRVIEIGLTDQDLAKIVAIYRGRWDE